METDYVTLCHVSKTLRLLFLVVSSTITIDIHIKWRIRISKITYGIYNCILLSDDLFPNTHDL